MVDLQKIEIFILEKLKHGLDARLTYHGVHHTVDVVNEAMRIAASEKISDSEELELLKIASLFHDSGFLFLYKDHEDKGCKLANEYLPAFGVSNPQLHRICGMIESTKIPQNPKNFMEQIICDADLDYLGRDDFYSIGKTLYREWRAYGMVRDEEEWNRKQLRFLEAHHYFTPSSIALRGEKKLKHLEELKEIVATYSD